MRNPTFVLVYQGGLANIFRINSLGRTRIMQHAFEPCEWFLRGMHAAGAKVQVAGCNMAGDIINQTWTKDLDSLPFSDKFACRDLQNSVAR